MLGPRCVETAGGCPLPPQCSNCAGHHRGTSCQSEVLPAAVIPPPLPLPLWVLLSASMWMGDLISTPEQRPEYLQLGEYNPFDVPKEILSPWKQPLFLACVLHPPTLPRLSAPTTSVSLPRIFSSRLSCFHPSVAAWIPGPVWTAASLASSPDMKDNLSVSCTLAPAKNQEKPLSVPVQMTGLGSLSGPCRRAQRGRLANLRVSWRTGVTLLSALGFGVVSVSRQRLHGQSEALQWGSASGRPIGLDLSQSVPTQAQWQKTRRSRHARREAIKADYAAHYCRYHYNAAASPRTIANLLLRGRVSRTKEGSSMRFCCVTNHPAQVP